jgi:hypothetical protein
MTAAKWALRSTGSPGLKPSDAGSRRPHCWRSVESVEWTALDDTRDKCADLPGVKFLNDSCNIFVFQKRS